MKKYLVRALGAVAAVAVISFLGLIVAIPYFVEGDRFREMVAAELAEATGLSVQVGRLRVAFPKGIGVRLENFELREPQGRSLIEAEGIFLGIKAVPLLRRKLIIRELVLTRPKVHWALDERGNPVLLGVLNALVLKMRQKELKPLIQPVFQLDKVGIEGGVVYLKEPQDALYTLHNVDFRIRKSILLNRLRAELTLGLDPEAGSGTIRVVGTMKVPDDLSQLRSTPVSINAQVDSLSASQLKQHLGLVPPDDLAGTFRVRAHLEGVLAEEMKVSARIGFSSLSLVLAKVFGRSETLGDGQLDLEGVLSPQKVEISKLNLRSSQISFDSTLLLQNRPAKEPGSTALYDLSELGSRHVSVDLHVNSVPALWVTRYLRFIPLDEVHGTFQANAHLEGVLAERINGRGRIGFSSLSFTVRKAFNEAQTLGDGHIEVEGAFSPGEMRLTKFNLRSPEVSFESTLLVENMNSEDPWLRFQVTTPFVETKVIKKHLPFRILRGPVWPYLNRVMIAGRCRFDHLRVQGSVSALGRIGRAAGGLLTLQVDCADGVAHLVGDRFLPLSEVEGRLTLENNVLKIVGFRGHYGRSNIDLVQGDVEGVLFGLTVLTLDIRAELDLAEAKDQFGLPFFGPASNRLAQGFAEVNGRGDLNLKFQGTFDGVQEYHYEGTVGFQSAAFRARDFPLPVSEIEGILAFSPTMVSTEVMRLSYGATPLVLKGSVDGFAETGAFVRATVSTEKGRFAEIGSLLFPKMSATNPGSFNGQLTVLGRMDQWQSSQWNGTVDFRGVELPVSFLREPLKAVRATAKFNGRAVALRGSGLLARQPFHFSFEMKDRNRPDASVELGGRGIDLNLLATESRENREKSGDLYGRVRVQGRLNFEDARFGNRLIDSLSASVSLEDCVWTISSVSARSGSARLSVRAVIADLTDMQGSRFEVQGKVESIDLKDLLVWASLPSTETTGRVSVEGELSSFGASGIERKRNLSGSLHVKAGKGVVKAFPVLVQILNVVDLTRWLTLKLPDFKSQGLPYKVVTGDVLIKDGHYTTENLFLDSDLVKITAAGSIDARTNGVDFRVAVRPFATVNTLIGKIPLVGAGLNLLQGSVLVAHLRVYGPMDQVKIVPAPLDMLTDFFRRALQLPQSLVPFSGERGGQESERPFEGAPRSGKESSP